MASSNEAAAREAANRITAILNGIPAALVGQMEDVVDQAVEDAKQRVPVDTGKLQRSIHGQVTVEGGTVRGEISAATEYAWYVEAGTSDTPAQPYMRPAAERARKSLPAAARKAVELSIQRGGK